MSEHIAICEKRLRTVLSDMRKEGVNFAYTTDIIDRYMGGFHSNKGVPASASWNAQFGKYLKAHFDQLGIQESKAGNKVTKNGDRTSASRWELLGVN